MADKIKEDRKGDANLDDVNIDLGGLDEINLETGDTGEGGTKNESGRNPDTPTKTYVIEAAKGVGEGIKAELGAALRREMPAAESIISDIKQGFSDFRDMKDELGRELAPMLTSLESSARKLLPKAQKYIPTKLYDKIKKKLDDRAAERAGSGGDLPSKAQMEAMTIADELRAIFESQTELAKQKEISDKQAELSSLALDASRHKQTSVILNHMYESMRAQELFHKTTFTAFMRKNLELKYKHLFIARDTFNLLELSLKKYEGYMKSLVKNSALPDMVKIHMGDYHKANRVQKWGKRMDEFMSSARDKIFGKIKDMGKNAVRGIGQFAEMAAMAAQQSQDADEMAAQQSELEDLLGVEKKDEGKQPSGVISTIANLVGTGIGRLGGGALLQGASEKLKPYTSEINGGLSHMKADAMLNLAQLRRKWSEQSDSRIKQFLADFLPDFEKTSTGTNALLDDADKAAVFDNMTRQSIVEIIPGFLSKIHNSIEKMRTGDENVEEQVYNVYSRKFTGVSQLKKDSSEFMFGTETERAESLKKTLTALGAGLAEHGAEKSPQEIMAGYEKDINRVFTNHALHVEFFDPNEIHDFLASDGKTGPSTYIKNICGGLEHDPREVLKIIHDSIFDKDGKIDKRIVNNINDALRSKRALDAYKTEMPKVSETYGYRSYFSDQIDDKTRKRLEAAAKKGDKSAQEELRKKLGDIGDKNQINISSLTEHAVDIDYDNEELNGAALKSAIEEDAEKLKASDRARRDAAQFADKVGIGKLAGVGSAVAAKAYGMYSGAVKKIKSIGKQDWELEFDESLKAMQERLEALQETATKFAGGLSALFKGPKEEQTPNPDLVTEEWTPGQEPVKHEPAKPKVVEEYQPPSDEEEKKAETPKKTKKAKSKKKAEASEKKSILDQAKELGSAALDKGKALYETSKPKVSAAIKTVKEKAPDISKEISTSFMSGLESLAAKFTSAMEAREKEAVTLPPDFETKFGDLQAAVELGVEAAGDLNTTAKSILDAIEKMSKNQDLLTAVTGVQENTASTVNILNSLVTATGGLSDKFGSLSIPAPVVNVAAPAVSVTAAQAQPATDMSFFEKYKGDESEENGLIFDALVEFKQQQSEEMGILFDTMHTWKEDQMAGIELIAETIRDSGGAGGGNGGEGGGKKGGVAGKILGGIGKGIKGVGKMYAKIYGSALEGLGTAAKGAFGFAGKIFDGAAKAAKFLTEKPDFCDIYLKGQEGGAPLVTARQQKEDPGCSFKSTGERVKRSKDINEPIVDNRTGNIVISEEDLKHGLSMPDGTSIAGKALGALGKGIAGVAKGYFGIYGKAIGAIGTMGKALIEGLVGGKGEVYCDIYRKDEIGGAYKPILTRLKQKRDPGVVDKDGNRIEKSSDIQGPVYDPVTSEELISQDDIDHGIVNVDNKPVGSGMSGGGGGGLLGKLVGAGKSAIKNFVGPAAMKGMDLYTHIYKGLFDLGVSGIKGAGKMIGNLFGKKKGGGEVNEELLTEVKAIGANIISIKEFMTGVKQDTANISKQTGTVAQKTEEVAQNTAQEEHAAGDKDGDGDVDGSYADQQEKKSQETSEKRDIGAELAGKHKDVDWRKKEEAEGGSKSESWLMKLWNKTLGGKIAKWSSGILAAASGFINKGLDKIGGLFKGLGKHIWSFTKTVGGKVWDFAKSFGKQLGPFTKRLGSNLGKFSKQFGGKLLNFTKGLGGKLGTFAKSLGGKMSKFLSKHSGLFGKQIWKYTKLFGNKLGGFTKVLGSKLGGFAKILGSKLGGFARLFGGKLGGFTKLLGGKLGGFAKLLGGKLGPLLGKAGGLLGKVGGVAGKALTGVGGKALGLVTKIPGVAGLAAKAGGMLGGLGAGGAGGLLGAAGPALAAAAPWVAGAAAVAGAGYLAYKGLGIGGLIKGIKGNDNPLTEKEIEQGRKKLAYKASKGLPGYDRILQEYEKAVNAQNWPRARQLSGQEADGIIKSMWKESWIGKGFRGIGNFLFGNKEKEMTEAEIKKVHAKFDSIIAKGGQSGKNAEKLKDKFDEYVAEGNWKKAREIAGMEQRGLFGKLFQDSKGNTQWKKLGGMALGAAIGGPVGALIGGAVGWLFTKKDPNEPMTEKEVLQERNWLQRQIDMGNKQAEKILSQFDDAVTEMNWKKARKLVGKEVKSNLSKVGNALKATAKWTARISTLGLSMLFEKSNDNPMTEKECQNFVKKMNYLISKGNKNAQKKLDAFEAAVAKQDWEKARKIAKMPDQMAATKAIKAVWAWAWGDDDVEMTEAEMKKFRDSMQRKIAMGNKAAQRKLDAFEDAVGRQNWRKARAIADAPNDGINQKAAKAIGKAAAGAFRFLFGGDKAAMSEDELAKARKILQNAVDDGKKNAKRRQDMFEDFVADEKWDKARALVKMPYENAAKRVWKGVKGFFVGGDNMKAMTPDEIEEFRSKCEARIADGNKRAEKVLADFNDAVEKERWDKARKISGTKDEGLWGSMKSVGKGIKKFFTGEKDRKDLEEMREKLEEKSLDIEDDTGIWQAGFEQFENLVRRRKFNEAHELGEDLLKMKPHELAGKHKLNTEKYEKLSKTAEEIAALVEKEEEDNNGWLHPVKEAKLASLRKEIRGDTDKWSDEFFEDARRKLSEITGNMEYTPKDDKPDDAIWNRGNELLATIDEVDNNRSWIGSPIIKTRLGNLRSEVKSDPTMWDDETIDEWYDRIGEIDEDYKGGRKNSPKDKELQERHAKLLKDLDKAIERANNQNPPNETLAAKLTMLKSKVEANAIGLSDDKLDEWYNELSELDSSFAGEGADQAAMDENYDWGEIPTGEEVEEQMDSALLKEIAYRKEHGLSTDTSDGMWYSDMSKSVGNYDFDSDEAKKAAPLTTDTIKQTVEAGSDAASSDKAARIKALKKQIARLQNDEAESRFTGTPFTDEQRAKLESLRQELAELEDSEESEGTIPKPLALAEGDAAAAEGTEEESTFDKIKRYAKTGLKVAAGVAIPQYGLYQLGKKFFGGNDEEQNAEAKAAESEEDAKRRMKRISELQNKRNEGRFTGEQLTPEEEAELEKLQTDQEAYENGANGETAAPAQAEEEPGFWDKIKSGASTALDVAAGIAIPQYGLYKLGKKLFGGNDEESEEGEEKSGGVFDSIKNFFGMGDKDKKKEHGVGGDKAAAGETKKRPDLERAEEIAFQYELVVKRAGNGWKYSCHIDDEVSFEDWLAALPKTDDFMQLITDENDKIVSDSQLKPKVKILAAALYVRDYYVHIGGADVVRTMSWADFHEGFLDHNQDDWAGTCLNFNLPTSKVGFGFLGCGNMVGMIFYCHAFGADKNNIAIVWASRAIDSETGEPCELEEMSEEEKAKRMTWDEAGTDELSDESLLPEKEKSESEGEGPKEEKGWFSKLWDKLFKKDEEGTVDGANVAGKEIPEEAAKALSNEAEAESKGPNKEIIQVFLDGLDANANGAIQSDDIDGSDENVTVKDWRLKILKAKPGDYGIKDKQGITRLKGDCTILYKNDFKATCMSRLYYKAEFAEALKLFEKGETSVPEEAAAASPEEETKKRNERISELQKKQFEGRFTGEQLSEEEQEELDSLQQQQSQTQTAEDSGYHMSDAAKTLLAKPIGSPGFDMGGEEGLVSPLNTVNRVMSPLLTKPVDKFAEMGADLEKAQQYIQQKPMREGPTIERANELAQQQQSDLIKKMEEQNSLTNKLVSLFSSMIGKDGLQIAGMGELTAVCADKPQPPPPTVIPIQQPPGPTGLDVRKQQG